MITSRSIHIISIGALALTVAPGCKRGSADASLKVDEAPAARDGDAAFLSKDELVASLVDDSTEEAMEDADDELTYGTEGSSVEALFEGAEAMDYDLDEGDSRGNYGSDIDLRRFDTPVKNQGREGLCTAFGTVSAIENMAMQKTGKAYDLSERHLWTMYKRYNTVAALKAAKQGDIVPESVWPYDDKRPSGSLDGAGVARIAALGTGVRTFKGMLAALKDDKPLVIGASTVRPFFRSSGVINVHKRESNTGHAMAVVGALYDSRFEGGGVLIIKNSWGPTRGDHGYVYMPFAYCKYHRCAAWAVEDVTLTGSDPDPMPGGGEVAVKVNYGAYANGYKSFTLSLETDAATLATIESVRYHVHKTFRDAEYADVSDASSAFETSPYRTYAKKWTTGAAIVKFTDGHERQIGGAPIRWSK